MHTTYYFNPKFTNITCTSNPTHCYPPRAVGSLGGVYLIVSVLCGRSQSCVRANHLRAFQTRQHLFTEQLQCGLRLYVRIVILWTGYICCGRSHNDVSIKSFPHDHTFCKLRCDWLDDNIRRQLISPPPVSIRELVHQELSLARRHFKGGFLALAVCSRCASTPRCICQHGFYFIAVQSRTIDYHLGPNCFRGLRANHTSDCKL
jgi:hypothetical protein